LFHQILPPKCEPCTIGSKPATVWVRFEASAEPGKQQEHSGEERSADGDQGEDGPVDVTPGEEVDCSVDVGGDVDGKQDNAESDKLRQEKEVLHFGMAQQLWRIEVLQFGMTQQFSGI
jgi:hypothetical protein